MAEIPNELLAQLHTALMSLGDAPQDVTDPIRERLGVETSMALGSGCIDFQCAT